MWAGPVQGVLVHGVLGRRANDERGTHHQAATGQAARTAHSAAEIAPRLRRGCAEIVPRLRRRCAEVVAPKSPRAPPRPNLEPK